MAVTVTEAAAVTRVLRRLGVPSFSPGVPRPTYDELFDALEVLAASASKRLQLTVARRGDLAAAVDRLTAVDSDGAAQAVCRALADHVAHGGAIPWPSIREPFDAWVAAQRAVAP